MKVIHILIFKFSFELYRLFKSSSKPLCLSIFIIASYYMATIVRTLWLAVFL